MPHYKVIGLMSGSSLDGLDIAYCDLQKSEEGWAYSILHADCLAYSKEWLERLRNARTLAGKGLWKLHADYGHLLAGLVNDFIHANHLAGKVDLIASHGHTIFHFADEKFTTQIGDGAAIAVGTGISVACDFRAADIALGGQGTPIAPIADLLLFQKYKYLLNIGGIANLTIKTGNEIAAFDICAANQVLNHYASQNGLEYDRGGALAASGYIHAMLLEALNKLPYYEKRYPKSLDNGFSKDVVIPLIDSFDISAADKLHTYCEHIAQQITLSMGSGSGKQDELFITGGGAFNTYLISRIAAHSPVSVHIPSAEIVQYKEALAIALIGALRVRQEPNVLAKVTGAARDSIGGALYHP
jgi:anhydro-N-acetylmuramic acid kinase